MAPADRHTTLLRLRGESRSFPDGPTRKGGKILEKYVARPEPPRLARTQAHICTATSNCTIKNTHKATSRDASLAHPLAIEYGDASNVLEDNSSWKPTMNIVILNGNPKHGGFIGGGLDIIAAHVERRGAEAVRVALADKHIADCVGCFNCLKTGTCTLNDDVDEIIRQLQEADGIVVGSPVRNGAITALYKRFYERITYRLGFTYALEGKCTLALSSVGYAGGKGTNARFLGLQDMGPRRSAYCFFRVGIPAKITSEHVRPRLERAVDTLMHDIETARARAWLPRFAATLDRAVMRRGMLKRHPEIYAHVIDCWKNKGYY